MKIIRTPDERFVGLPGYDYAPHYLEITDATDGTKMRVHYLDEGPRDARPILLMHGEPSWCYLYRAFIPPLVAAGFRVVAPDLIGFGRSDKPCAQRDYSYARHVGWMRSWLEALDLNDIVLGCQDWGSLIGLRLVAAMEHRFGGVVLSNGGLPEGGPAPRAFKIWRAFARFSPAFPIGKIISAGTRRGLSDAERAAYDAPFPDARYKAGSRIFPALVPFAGNAAIPDQQAAWAVLERFEKPFLCAFSNADPITRTGETRFIGRVPGTANMPHRTLKGGHFIQEDDADGFVGALLEVAKS